MIQFNKKDKNGEDIIIKIVFDDYVPTVRCKFYVEKIRKGIFRERKVLVNKSSFVIHVEETVDWTCKDFEAWSDRCIKAYNADIVYTENIEKTKNFIKNGCNK